ncbi:MAG: tRNA pseudouridine(55) synthase TruB [Erythrobacter sp.]|uniref:tRNA pseudouridine(55) synthase TruB n=1 Tax=Erythrobacter sp. TaxID=1042 RepID=UPI0032F015D9
MKDTSKPALHGWLVLDKPRGMGSTQAVGKVKRLLRESGYAKTKVGHGGTLDPLAEGVLPIALGEATKLAGRMLDSDKIYDFTIAFGEETDTLDSEGEVIARSDRFPPLAAIAGMLDHFTGEIEQLPPAYSAILVDGKRAYDLARAGEEVKLQPRRVTIHSLGFAGGAGRSGEGRMLGSSFQNQGGRPDPFSATAPLKVAEAVTLTAHVSKGTYIRSLARDIALALGSRGHVTYLRRTKAGPFREQQAISLDFAGESDKGPRLDDLILPLEAGLDDISALSLDRTSAQAVRQGRVLSGMPQLPGLYLAKLGDVPVALVEIEGGTAKVVRGFNLPDVAE